MEIPGFLKKCFPNRYVSKIGKKIENEPMSGSAFRINVKCETPTPEHVQLSFIIIILYSKMVMLVSQSTNNLMLTTAGA